jgi:hypothetical protein
MESSETSVLFRGRTGLKVNITDTVMQCSFNVIWNVSFLKGTDVSSGLLTWHLCRRIRTRFNAFLRHVSAQQAHYLWSDHHNNVWRKVKLMKLFYMHFSLCFYSFFFLRSNIPVSGLLSCVINLFSFLIVTVFFLQSLFIHWVFHKVEDSRFHNSRHKKAVGLSARRTLHTRKYSWYSFLLETESTPGPWWGRKDYANEESPWHRRGSNLLPSVL